MCMTHITFLHKNWAFINKALVFGMAFGNLWFGSNYFCPKQYSVVPYQASSNLKVGSTLKEPRIVVKKYWFLVFRMV